MTYSWLRGFKDIRALGTAFGRPRCRRYCISTYQWDLGTISTTSRRFQLDKDYFLLIFPCQHQGPRDKDPGTRTPGQGPRDKDPGTRTPGQRPRDKDPGTRTPGLFCVFCKQETQDDEIQGPSEYMIHTSPAHRTPEFRRMSVCYRSKVSWWTVASLLWSIDQVCAAVCALQLCALCVYYISKVSWWTVASLLWSIDQVCAAVCALQLCALCVYYISKVSW